MVESKTAADFIVIWVRLNCQKRKETCLILDTCKAGYLSLHNYTPHSTNYFFLFLFAGGAISGSGI